MARLPDYNPVAPRFSGLTPPEGAFRVSFESAEKLTNTIGASIDTVHAHLMQAQRIKNKKDIQEQIMAMEKLQADFQNEIVKNNMDPAVWLPEWEKRLATFKATMDGRKLPPAVMNELNLRFGDFAGSSSIAITGGALKENRRVASGLYRERIKDLQLRGDFDGADSLANEAEEENIFDEVEATGIKLSNSRARDNFTIEQEINMDPVAAVKNLEPGGKWADKTEYEKSKIKEAAETERAKRASAEIDLLTTEVERNPNSSKEEIDSLVDASPNLNDQEKKATKANLFNKTAIPAGDKFLIGDRIRDDFNAYKNGQISREEYVKRYSEMDAILASQGKRPGAGELRGQLAQRFQVIMGPNGGGGSDDESRARAKEFKSLSDDISEMIRKRASGLADINIGKAQDADRTLAEDGNKARLAEVRANEDVKAVRFRSAMETALNEWLATEINEGRQPNATQALEYMDKIQPKIAEEVAMQAKAEREKPLQRAPKGAKFNKVKLKSGEVIDMPADVLPEWNDDQREFSKELDLDNILLPPID